MTPSKWIWLSFKVVVWSAWAFLIVPRAINGDFTPMWVFLSGSLFWVISDSLGFSIAEAVRPKIQAATRRAAGAPR